MNKVKLSLIAAFVVILAALASFAIISHSPLQAGLASPLPTGQAEEQIQYYTGYDTNEEAAKEIESVSEIPQLFSQKVYLPDDKAVKPIGRTVYSEDERWFSMSGSGVEFTTRAKGICLTFLTDPKSGTYYNHLPRVAVFADNTLLYDNCLDENETLVYIDLSGFNHRCTISVVKLSESMYSSMGLGKIITCDGKIQPAKEKKLKIEFIGDSITSGFGIDEKRQNASFSTKTENFAKTYAYLTAKTLNADYSAVSFAGYGVVSGYTTGGRREDTTIFRYYENALTNCKAIDSNLAENWQFTAFVPNIVVINLGSNDSTYCVTSTRRKEFIDEYKRLIELVRSKYENAYILCILGDVNNSLYPSIQTAVDEYSQDTADSKISCEKIEFNMDENDIVIEGHPGEMSNKSAAYDLVKIINKILIDEAK